MYLNEPIDIYDEQTLFNLIDDKGEINQSIILRGETITTLGGVRKIQGSIGIICSTLIDLGELTYVKEDFWLNSACKTLVSLGNLERVDGNVSLRYSKISNLGRLTIVGGKLSTRDTPLEGLDPIISIGGDLFVSKNLKKLDISKIDVGGKVRYWKDIEPKSSSKQELFDVGGENLRYNIFIPHKFHDFHGVGISRWGEVWDSKKGFEIWLMEWAIPDLSNQKYHVPKAKQKSQLDSFIQMSKELDLDSKYLNIYKDDCAIENFRNRLIYELLKSFKLGKMDFESFLSKTVYYEKVFSNFNIMPRVRLEFLPIYVIAEKKEYIIDLVQSTPHHLSFSEIHSLEYQFKTRLLGGRRIVGEGKGLNEFVQKSLKEFIQFIDLKLSLLYGGKDSFFDAVFNQKMTLEEINNEFPDEFKIERNLTYSQLSSARENAYNYFEDNKSKNPFKKYYKALSQYDAEINLDYFKRDEYGENPLNYYREDPNKMINFVETTIYVFFSSFVYKFQNEFRVSKGLPKIGEGWASETELYHLIKDNFPKTKVIHHGKPEWLGRQHVDIWIPKHRIGIEYQGRQHYEPIEFFGGEEAFLKGKERDKRKRKLFIENSASLIEVQKGYDVSLVFFQINELMNPIK